MHWLKTPARVVQRELGAPFEGGLSIHRLQDSVILGEMKNPEGRRGELMNIRFEYLYRCAGNYKNWGEVVFRNSAGESAESLETRLQDGLIDGEFFVAEQVGLPTLYFDEVDSELDHGWHEFSSLRETDEPVTDQTDRDISEVVDCLMDFQSNA